MNNVIKKKKNQIVVHAYDFRIGTSTSNGNVLYSNVHIGDLLYNRGNVGCGFGGRGTFDEVMLLPAVDASCYRDAVWHGIYVGHGDAAGY